METVPVGAGAVFHSVSDSDTIFIAMSQGNIACDTIICYNTKWAVPQR